MVFFTRHQLIRIFVIICVIGVSYFAVTYAKEDLRVDIFHTNDMHACLKPAKNGKGGIAFLAGCIKRYRSEFPHMLLVDSGDRILKGDLMVANSNGRVAYTVLEQVGYDAYALGNTDFSYGLEAIKEYRTLSEVPFLCANVTDANDSLIADAPYITKEIEGVAVVLTSMMYAPDKDDPLTKKFGESLKFTNPESVVVKTITSLKEQGQGDFFIILSHLGWEADKQLAEKIQYPSLIIGAHSHTSPESMFINSSKSVYVVQAGAYAQSAGHATLWINPQSKTVTDCRWELLALDREHCASDSSIETLLTSLEAQYAPGMSEVVGEAAESFDTWMPLANLSTYALRSAYNADIAIIDRGFVRNELEKGVITREDIYRKIPYENKVATFKATGDELLIAFEHNLKGPLKGRVDIGGCSGEFELSAEGVFTRTKTDLDKAKTYLVVTSEYIMKNAEFFLGKAFSYETQPKDVREVEVEYINHAKVIRPDVTESITCTGCEKPDRRVTF